MGHLTSLIDINEISGIRYGLVKKNPPFGVSYLVWYSFLSLYQTLTGYPVPKFVNV